MDIPKNFIIKTRLWFYAPFLRAPCISIIIKRKTIVLEIKSLCAPLMPNKSFKFNSGNSQLLIFIYIRTVRAKWMKILIPQDSKIWLNNSTRDKIPNLSCIKCVWLIWTERKGNLPDAYFFCKLTKVLALWLTRLCILSIYTSLLLACMH